MRLKRPYRPFLPLVAISLLLLAMAPPALAAPPQSGTALGLSGADGFCDETGCTYQELSVGSPGPLGGYLIVCLDRFTATLNGEYLTREYGCVDVPESSVIVLELNPLTMKLIPTELTLTALDGSTRTVTVSMRQKAWEPTPAFRGTESFDGPDGCLYTYKFVHRSANSRGTYTIDGEAFHNRRTMGGVGLTENRLKVTCP